jgi:hypothetical protein
MPISMLPPALFKAGCKVIYVCRNPKDACVSYFHHTALLFPHFKESFEHFEAMFMEGKVEYGSYWYHLKVWTAHNQASVGTAVGRRGNS